MPAGLTEVAGVPVATSRGALVPVGELAKVGRDLGGFIDAAKIAVAAAVKLPAGYFLRWGGQFENLARARARLLVAVPLALGLIFLMLFVAFRSARPALLIYLNVPMAATGGIAALLPTLYAWAGRSRGRGAAPVAAALSPGGAAGR